LTKTTRQHLSHSTNRKHNKDAKEKNKKMNVEETKKRENNLIVQQKHINGIPISLLSKSIQLNNNKKKPVIEYSEEEPSSSSSDELEEKLEWDPAYKNEDLDKEEYFVYFTLHTIPNLNWSQMSARLLQSNSHTLVPKRHDIQLFWQ
jgi:hypothetical protein